jgi:chromosome segregation ATPase
MYQAKLKQMMAKMKEYEQENTIHEAKFGEVQKECLALQAKVTAMDASRQQLETCLKDETVARSQLVSQVFHLRKVKNHHINYPSRNVKSPYKICTIILLNIKRV